MIDAMVVTVDIEKTKQVSDWLKQIQAGNEVLLTQGDKPVARLLPPARNTKPVQTWDLPLPLRGHKVLKPDFTHAEIAEEMFGQDE